jgi:hypothetical protein
VPDLEVLAPAFQQLDALPVTQVVKTQRDASGDYRSSEER